MINNLNKTRTSFTSVNWNSDPPAIAIIRLKKHEREINNAILEGMDNCRKLCIGIRQTRYINTMSSNLKGIPKPISLIGVRIRRLMYMHNGSEE